MLRPWRIDGDNTERSVQWYADPSHAWLAVPASELLTFNPSSYSYKKDGIAYLEEDCDAPAWIAHRGFCAGDLDFMPEIYCSVDSTIRNYPRFRTAK